MKPASVIFLIFALTLIIAGSIVCSVAVRKAEKTDTAIFDYAIDDDGNVIEKISYSRDNVTKLDISVKECNVRVIGGASESYVELVNFGRNDYSLSVSNSNMEFSDSISWKSFVRISSGGISFDGLRYFLPVGKNEKPKIPENAERIVNIYVSASDSINKININSEYGTITVSGLSTNADIQLRTECGNIEARNLTSISTFSAYSEKGNILLHTESDTADISLKTDCGDVALQIPSAPVGALDITATAVISYFGEQVAGPYSRAATNGNNKIALESANGSVYVCLPS